MYPTDLSLQRKDYRIKAHPLRAAFRLNRNTYPAFLYHSVRYRFNSLWTRKLPIKLSGIVHLQPIRDSDVLTCCRFALCENTGSYFKEPREYTIGKASFQISPMSLRDCFANSQRLYSLLYNKNNP